MSLPCSSGVITYVYNISIKRYRNPFDQSTISWDGICFFVTLLQCNETKHNDHVAENVHPRLGH